jgi:hypothetical protein
MFAATGANPEPGLSIGGRSGLIAFRVARPGVCQR